MPRVASTLSHNLPAKVAPKQNRTTQRSLLSLPQLSSHQGFTGAQLTPLISLGGERSEGLLFPPRHL